MNYFFNQSLFGIAKILAVLFVLSLATTSVNGQILTDFPCYTVSNANGVTNMLFTYSTITHTWSAAANRTGATDIAAIAVDSDKDIIYAIDGGTFGSINAETGIFTKIGTIGAASGNAGVIELNDVQGMTFDPINRIMYGVHRVMGEGVGTEDLLFQIDITTGAFVPFAMLNNDGSPADYTIIEALYDDTLEGEIYDVTDIAYHPYTGDLYALYSQNGPSTIAIIEPNAGYLESVVFDIDDKFVDGLGFTYLGELYATEGNFGDCGLNDPFNNNCKNMLLNIDLSLQTTAILLPIDMTATEFNFESFDCSKGYNDLALEMTLDPSTPSTVNPGDEVTFVITVHNQGSIENSEINLTNYIPAGLTLADNNWVTYDEIAYFTIQETLISGASTTVTITFLVNPDFTGTLTNAAEITASYNSFIVTPYGDALPLPDIDSQPNDINDENPSYVLDDEIDQGGPNATADEDDHDIELLTVGTEMAACPPNLIITSSGINNNTYQSSGNLSTYGVIIIAANRQVEYNARIITLNSGFEVETGGEFYANSKTVNCN